jgi:sigma-B regulation protein RsbU (phosphoserine phosphatase)
VSAERHPADRLQRLQALTDAALAHLELDHLLAALLQRTKELLETDTCAMLLLDEARQELVARAAVGIEEGECASRSARGSRGGSPQNVLP